jgi:hypothetical protein
MVMRLQFYVNIETDKIELSINCSKLGVKSKVRMKTVHKKEKRGQNWFGPHRSFHTQFWIWLTCPFSTASHSKTVDKTQNTWSN